MKLNGCAPLDLAPRDALGLVPLTGPEAQPGERRRGIRGYGVHLVLLGVGERLLRVSQRRLRLRPADERVGQVVERATRLVPVPCGVGDGVSLEEHRGRLGIQLDPGAADVDERVCAGALVAEPDRELERPIAPRERLLGLLREHGGCESTL